MKKPGFVPRPFLLLEVSRHNLGVTIRAPAFTVPRAPLVFIVTCVAERRTAFRAVVVCVCVFVFHGSLLDKLRGGNPPAFRRCPDAPLLFRRPAHRPADFCRIGGGFAARPRTLTASHDSSQSNSSRRSRSSNAAISSWRTLSLRSSFNSHASTNNISAWALSWA